jgi:putative Holliday junction resolvase
MGRILAIDYGQKRVGLAVTDPMQLIANSLDTVSAHDALNYIKGYVEREQVDKFVVGLPKQMNGTDSQSMQYITPFVKKMREMFPNIELIYVDERFTSVLAHKTMLDGGLKKKDRQDKALVDRISATIILQTYMESIR